jgi:hypothetical protein
MTTLNTTALGPAGVNHLFKMYYGRDATKEELAYWQNKSDAELRPKLIPNSAVQLAKNTGQQPAVSPAVQTSPKPASSGLNTTQLGAAGVNHLFNLYYGRDASRDEIAYWQNKSDADLRPKLIPNSKTELERRRIEATPAQNEEAPKMSDGSETSNDAPDWLNEFQRALWDRVMNSEEVTSGQKILTKEEIDKLTADMEVLATADLDPYYEKIKGETVQDLRHQYEDLRNQSLRYQQKEEKSYKEKLAETKQSLRARGLTFSGANRKTLGDESALEQEGAMGTDKYVEGELPQSRRYNWEDMTAQWQQSARNMGVEAERYLGSAGLADTGLSNIQFRNPYDLSAGNLAYQGDRQQTIYQPKQSDQDNYVRIGDWELERKRAIEEEAQRRVEQQRLYI